MTKNNKKVILIAAIIMLLTIAIYLLCPDMAFAEENSGPKLSGIITSLKTIVTVLLLPIGILICVWKLVYVAVFGGLIGADPLHMIDEGNNGGTPSMQEVTDGIKSQLIGTLKGLCWVGGVWILFEICLQLAQWLSSSLITGLS